MGNAEQAKGIPLGRPPILDATLYMSCAPLDYIKIHNSSMTFQKLRSSQQGYLKRDAPSLDHSPCIQPHRRQLAALTRATVGFAGDEEQFESPLKASLEEPLERSEINAERYHPP